jgi:pyridoxal phosphate enzyme (YggS family)
MASSLETEIQSRLSAIQHDMAGRPVTLVAVTKNASLAQMEAAYQCGVRHFGENRVQDALDKKACLPKEVVDGVTWHLIGHLQSNKINKTLGQFDLIHSIDTLPLAEAVSLRNVNANLVQPVLLQVNVAKEPSKHGFSPAELDAAYSHCRTLKGIEIKGLMTMAPANVPSSEIENVFLELEKLRQSLVFTFGDSLPECSMGMSQDYIHALPLGATIIRIGSAIFG